MVKILYGITSSIAAYKAPHIVRLMQAQNWEVTTVLSHNAHQFVAPYVLEVLTQKKVYQDLFAAGYNNSIAHIELVRTHDVYVIAPITAHHIAKLAQGMADDMISTLALASKIPLLIVPAMNPAMWHHPATQANIKILQDRGVYLMHPEEGVMACGEQGCGRMPDENSIIKYIEEKIISRKNEIFSGKHIIVTGGSTREYLDPIRYITNEASGYQAALIVDALVEGGAKVTYVHGNCKYMPKSNAAVLLKEVQSAEQMLEACQDSGKADVLIGTAAVADWAPIKKHHQKIKKQGSKSLTLDFIPTVDILATISKSKKRPDIVIGFCLETEDLGDRAQDKMVKKNLDLLCAISAKDNAFGVQDIQGFWLEKGKK